MSQSIINFTFCRMKCRVCFSINIVQKYIWVKGGSVEMMHSAAVSCGTKKGPLTVTAERKYPNTHVCGVWPPAWACGLQRVVCNGGGLCVNTSLDVSGAFLDDSQTNPIRTIHVFQACNSSLAIIVDSKSPTSWLPSQSTWF